MEFKFYKKDKYKQIDVFLPLQRTGIFASIPNTWQGTERHRGASGEQKRKAKEARRLKERIGETHAHVFNKLACSVITRARSINTYSLHPNCKSFQESWRIKFF